MADSYSLGGGGGTAGESIDDSSYALDKPYDISGQPSSEKMDQLDEMLSHLFKANTRASTDISTINTTIASGVVSGPASSTTGDVAQFADATGTLLSDSGTLASTLVTGPSSVTADGNVVLFNGTTGKIVKDSAAAFGGFGSIGSVLKEASLNLIDADIKSLNTVPINIVTGVANKVLIPVSLRAHWNYVSGYSASSKVRLRWAGDGTDINGTLSNTWISNVIEEQIGLDTEFTRTRTAYSSASGVALEISSSGDRTGGNSANYLKIRLAYLEVADW